MDIETIKELVHNMRLEFNHAKQNYIPMPEDNIEFYISELEKELEGDD